MARTASIIIALAFWAQAASAVTRYVNINTTNGDTNNSCAASQNINTPKQHITGVNGALRCMAAGDVLLIRGGTYNEVISDNDINLRPVSGTSWSNFTRIAAYPGETVLMQPTGNYGLGPPYAVVGLGTIDTQTRYIEFDGITFDGRYAGNDWGYIGIVPVSLGCGTNNWSSGASYIRVQNSTLWAARGHESPSSGAMGFALFVSSGAPGCQGDFQILNNVVHGGGFAPMETEGTGSFCYGQPCQGGYCVYGTVHNSVFDGNDMTDCRWLGLQLSSAGNDPVFNITVRNNVLHDIVRGPIAYYGGGDISLLFGEHHYNITAYNNIIYHTGNTSTNDSIGIANIIGVHDVRLYNNTVWDTVQGIGIFSANNTSSITVRNNISDNSGIADYESDATDTNCASGTTNSFTCADGVSTVNTTANQNFAAGTNNFHLTTTSPARNTGVSLSGTFNTDKEGTTRPQESFWDRGAYEFTPGGGSPPTAAVMIYPLNNTTHIRLQPTMRFDSPTATFYDVYGDNFSPPTTLRSNDQPGNTYAAAFASSANTTYYTRVDACNGFGCTTGTVRNFTTGNVTDFTYDTFVDSDGVNVLSHFGEATVWTTKSNSTGDWAVSNANRAYPSITSGDNTLIADVNAPDGTYFVNCQFTVMTVAGIVGCGAYTKPTSPEGYFFFYDGNGDGLGDYSWQLMKIRPTGEYTGVAGAPICSMTLTPGVTYNATFTVTPASQNLIITGGTGCNISGTDTELSGPGRAAVMSLSDAGTNTTGIHLDHIVATDVAPAVPDVPTNPSPADLVTNVTVGSTLTWTATGATTCNRYFGTTNPPPFIANGNCTSYTPTTAAGTVYYWKIEGVNSNGTTAGPVWQFTTASPPLGTPIKVRWKK